MDGVIVDSEPVHFESAVRMLAGRGIGFTRDDNREFLGSTDRRMFEILKDRCALESTVEELVAERKAIYTEIIAERGQPWRDGILKLIADLRETGYRLAVCSSALSQIIARVLADGGIVSHFDSVVSGDDVRAPKPAPDIYREAARRLAVSPGLCVAIEDTDVGVGAAQSAGMSVIAFPNDTTRALDFSRADVIVETAADIRRLLLP